MIVWLASFPRSGNTLTRTILKQVFERESYSVYDDSHDLGADPEIAAAVGHVRHGERWDDAYRRLTDDDALHFVKTHEPPQDAARAIYVVREPVACFVSLRHYLRTYFQRDFRPEEFAAGLTPWGSWSSHIETWDPERRPATLLLRFEDLVGNPEPEIARIADFIGLKPINRWVNKFDQLRQAEPRFFRRGRVDADDAEVRPDDAHLIRFWSRRSLARFGYDRPAEASSPQLVNDSVRRVGEYLGLRIKELNEREQASSGRIAALEERNAALELRTASLEASGAELRSHNDDLARRLTKLEERPMNVAKVA